MLFHLLFLYSEILMKSNLILTVCWYSYDESLPSDPTEPRVPEVIQGRGGETRERGIQGAGGESRAAGPNRAKKVFCHVLSFQFFVNISKIKT